MRELINNFTKILNETDIELIKVMLSENNTQPINESSLNRIRTHVTSHDCAVITAFRKQLINCLYTKDNEKYVNLKTNKDRNKSIKSVLLFLGYGITDVKGTYIENYMQENEVEVNEDSFFVVNTSDKPDFIKTIIKLGKLFCQDSVLILPKGGTENFLYGTNNSNFPGLDSKFDLGSIRFGKEKEFMTKINGRPFTIEHFNSLQNNSKRIVTELAKPIIKKLS